MGKRTLKPAAPAPDVLDEDMDDDLDDEGGGIFQPVSHDDDFEDDDEPEPGPTCVYCECDETHGCNTPNGPCSWHSIEPRVCSAPDCIAAFNAHDENDAAVGTADDAEPSITETEATTPAVSPPAGELRTLPLTDIAPDPAQARDEGADEDLAPSIAAQGVLQPIRVYRHPFSAPNDFHRWMIDDGERRYRGALKAGLTEIPARIIDPPADVGDKLLRQILLNDGKRLKPMEEARSWKRIMDAKGWTAQQLAKEIGRAKSTVSDRLSMLDAPTQLQPFFVDGTLSAAAAPIVRRFVEVPPAIMDKIVENAKQNFNWRQAERERRTLTLDQAWNALSSSLGYPFPSVTDKDADAFTGESFVVQGKKYAVDYNAYQKHLRAHEPASRDRKNSKSAKTRELNERKQRAEAEAKRQREAERSKLLGKARAGAINAKLPDELNAAACLMVIEVLLDTMSGDTDDLAWLAGIESPAKSNMSSWRKPIDVHIAKLNAKQRQKFILQILLADHVHPNQWKEKELKAFAALTRVDLKKIKPPADLKPVPAKVQPSAAKPAKKAPKKSTSKKRS